jgi:hypothetical protein
LLEIRAKAALMPHRTNALLAALVVSLTLFAAGCATSIKPPPLPPSPNVAAKGSTASPASYVLPDGTMVHAVKCSCCQH